jgi:hypothetical protein
LKQKILQLDNTKIVERIKVAKCVMDLASIKTKFPSAPLESIVVGDANFQTDKIQSNFVGVLD